MRGKLAWLEVESSASPGDPGPLAMILERS